MVVIKSGGILMINVFLKTEKQKAWLQKLLEKEVFLRSQSAEIDELSIFPKENFDVLIGMGYNRITLPQPYGGEGLKVYDMVLLQETLASLDANTALSIGWNLGVVGELYEKQLWGEKILTNFAEELRNGAIINRAVSEAQTGSPTRGGRPGTYAIKQGNQWVINGRKNFTTASPVLTHFLVSAWVEEKKKVGFFLIPRETEGLGIEETWDVISMKGTGSHDLILENVTVNEEMLVELPNKPAGASLNGWLLHIPACYLGIAQAARDYAIHFSTRYSPNSLDGTISQLPHIQQHIGEIDLELIRARHLIYSVAEAYDDESRRIHLSNELGVVKHTVTNSSIRIVDKAMRIVGAKSLQRNNPLQRYYRDVRSGLHNPPMDDMTIKNLATSAIKGNKL